MGVTKMAAGFAVGYVLGTRAGRDTYERIVDGTRTLANQPATQRPFGEEPRRGHHHGEDRGSQGRRRDQRRRGNRFRHRTSIA